MTDYVVGLVVLSSLLHLTWNATIRSSEGNLVLVWLLVLSGGIMTAIVTLVLGIPWDLSTIWPWSFATILVHTAYFWTLARSYRQGALQEVYPVARGGGILLTMLVTREVFHQSLSIDLFVGTLLIALTIIIQPWNQLMHRQILTWALFVAAFIALYSVIDSHSVHLVSPWPYVSLQYLGTAFALTPQVLKCQRSLPVFRGILSGIASVLSYLLILYAYRLAPVGPVLALRQVSIGVAPIVGWLLFRERWRWSVFFRALVMLVGVGLILIG
ncbi:EamA family transporter [Sulfobacillus thermosulfidooxidans]|uniref:EamA family transporter n=1 Tax=Sulfobacillus thermosulfidooxidans TaxID=28034 RepID=UPI0004159CB8|nr:EamA family transporter [Sulfobacillus thermosulfidooxidans]